METDLTGKVALVSGAARGQGRSHAVALAEAGADIIAFDLCDRVAGVSYNPATDEDLAETVRRVESFDRRIVADKADVRSWEQVHDIVERGVTSLGRLDIVAANAGICGPPTPSEEISDEAFVTMQQINVIGMWRTCKAAIPHLRASGDGGSMILTSSAAGLIPYANISDYVVSKHGVVGLMRVLALELAPHSIRVNSVHPTTVATDMVLNDATYRLFRPDLTNPNQDDFAEAATEMNALPVPWVESSDVTNAVVFLASDAARYITGVTLPVDAGATIK